MLIHITYILSQTTTTMDIIFWGFYTILFFLPQVKRTVIISYKHDILMFHHELSNDLRLRIPEPTVSSPMDGPLSQHKKKKTYASSPPHPHMKTTKTRAPSNIPPMNTLSMAAPGNSPPPLVTRCRPLYIYFFFFFFFW